MIIHESAEMYLETILVLQNRNGFVRAIDIAKEMEFSKPTVSIALKKLHENEYINIDVETNYITLTSKGSAIALDIYGKHTALTTFLKAIGVTEPNASLDACKIEHDISKETFECVKKFISK